MRALRLVADRQLELADLPPPTPPGAGEVQVAVRAVALNHIDVWGWRGMAFAKRQLPLVIGAEAAGEIAAIGDGVEGLAPGATVALYGALTCGKCRPCLEGRDNLCENVAGVMGFHRDGFAQELVNIPARLVVPAPTGVDVRDAACAPITFGTAEHMLFDNARLEAGEWVLVQAGGSGVGSAAVRLAKAAGAEVIATVGDEEKRQKALAIGADFAINYNAERFEGEVRKITKKRGVEVVFEHVGAATWAGSLLSLKPGGRLVTCGSTTGVSAQTNLFQIFQRQLRIIGSFGCRIDNLRTGLAKMAAGIAPVIDSEIALEDFSEGLDRLESRRVFGKIVVRL
jgi:alcohol dehydrogenase